MSNFDEEFMLGSHLAVIASQRVRAKRGPMTGSAKQSRVSRETLDWFVASLLAMTVVYVQTESLLPIRHAHASADVVLDTIGRDRIAQAVLGQLFHAGNGLGKKRRRQRHQHFLVRHAAIATLGKARQRQARLAGLECPSPRIRTGRLADYAPFEFPVAGILQTVDQD